MHRQLQISSEPIDEAALCAARQPNTTAGAVVRFSGVVRGSEAGEPIAALEYEAFHKMAQHQFNLLFDEMEKRWPVLSVRLVHRVGRVPAGEPSLWVEVTTPHRAAAFAACQWLIDEMKRLVPIWKRPEAS
jgi:molybdopterin synthase catalytic subunit